MSNIKIYDRSGKQLTEISATCNRTWILSDVGRAEFELSIYDKKCNPDYLRFGNLILIESAKLPIWSGVIDTPRTWGGGAVVIQAYTAEYMFTYSIGHKDVKIKGTVATLIREVLKLSKVPIAIGTIEDENTQYEEVFNPTSILDTLKRIVTRAGGDFIVRPVINQYGQLSFAFDYFRKLECNANFILKEGYNLALANRTLIEQGTITNELLGYGEGVNWQSKPQYVGREDMSISLYGLRQGSQFFQGVTQVAAVKKHTTERLEVVGYPRMVVDAQVLDIGDAWQNLRLGANVNIELHTAGFMGSAIGYKGTLRIVGIEYTEDKGYVRVIGKEEDTIL